MSGLENVIRPFQTGEISPPKPQPTSADSAVPSNVILTPGKGGSVKTLSGSYNITITYYYIKKPKEKEAGMTTIFRTAGLGERGQGTDLTAAQVDQNFYDKETRITAIEGAGVARGITSIVQSGNQLIITYTDASTDTFNLDVITSPWVPMGEWQPSSLYSQFDVVSYRGSLYLVNFDHTSDLTFDPNEIISSGQVYTVILQAAGIPVVIETGSTFTPQLGDEGTFIRFTNVAGCTITIPQDSDVDFPLYSELNFRQSTDAGLTFVAGGSAIINPVSGFLDATDKSGAVVTFKKVAANIWDKFGLLAAV